MGELHERSQNPASGRLPRSAELAYLILAHDRPQQLARLVRRLSGGLAHVFVHVDAGTSRSIYEEARAALPEDGVTWLPRLRVRWGRFSQVEAVLLGLRAMLRNTPHAGHAVVLSGRDYPLKPRRQIEDLFARRRGLTLLHHFALPAEEWAHQDGGLDRVRFWYSERLAVGEHRFRLPLYRRSLPLGLEPYGGSFWCGLSREAAEYVVRETETRPELERFFRHALNPDELFVHTLLLNSPLRGQVLNEALHHVEWRGGAHPLTLGIEHLDALRGSDRFFARKFDVELDAEVLEALDRELLARTGGSIR